MINSRQQLRVNRESAIKLVSGRGDEALGEFPLEHENGAAEERPMQQQLEDERRRDLVWHVGNAHVEERQLKAGVRLFGQLMWRTFLGRLGQHRAKPTHLGFDRVSDDNLQLVLHWSSQNTLLQFGHHSSIDFHRHNFFYVLE